MNTARAVKVIPPKVSQISPLAVNSIAKKRVAAYARVSTDSEEQLSSYEAQVDYYTRYIKSNPEWEFVDVYTDEEYRQPAPRSGRIQAHGGRRAGWQNRPDYYQVGVQVRPQHGGYSDQCAEAQR